jgi:hypothetical protein
VGFAEIFIFSECRKWESKATLYSRNEKLCGEGSEKLHGEKDEFCSTNLYLLLFFSELNSNNKDTGLQSIKTCEFIEE